MSIETLLHMVDEFGRAMRDSGKNPASVEPIVLNRQREELHEAIRALALTGDAASVGPATIEARQAIEKAALAPPPPVDRNAVTLTDGSPVTADHREINPNTGLQKGYVVLSAEERARGWVRPYRDAYVHMTCTNPAKPPNITVTTMSRPLAETYARDPKFYSGTFCRHCREHHAVHEFRWYEMDGTLGPVVGS